MTEQLLTLGEQGCFFYNDPKLPWGSQVTDNKMELRLPFLLKNI